MMPGVKGEAKSAPDIFLHKSATPDCMNVRVEYGRIRTTRGRLAEMVESPFDTTDTTATVVDDSTTVTASEGAGTWGTSATHKPYWTGRKIYFTTTLNGVAVTVEKTIASVADDGATLVITEAWDVDVDGVAGDLAYSIGTLNTRVATPDSNPVIKYFRASLGSPATEYLLCFTKRNAYLWDSKFSAWMLKYTYTSDITHWSVCQYGDMVIATNGLDKVQKWGTEGALVTTDLFANLDGASGLDIGGGSYITKAKYVTVFENYIVFGYITYGGSDYPNMCACSDLAQPEVYDTGDASQWAELGNGYINGFGVDRSYLVIFKSKSIVKRWLVSGTDIFNGAVLSSELGCISPDSIIQGKDGLIYFFATDYTFRNIELTDISKLIDPECKKLLPSLVPYIRGISIDQYGELLWSVPYGSTATENNRIFRYLPAEEYQVWTFDNFPVSAWGRYSRATELDWAHLPYDSWNEWDWESWDAIQGQAGFEPILCGDYSDYTNAYYGADSDVDGAFESWVVIQTDMGEGGMLHLQKDFNYMDIYCQNMATGTMTVYVKADEESTWTNAGTINIYGDNEVLIQDNDPFMQGKTFKIKFHTNGYPFSLLGVRLDYVVVGDK